MNRSTFNGMLGQYAVQELTGEGHVSWENGAHCVIPKVEIRGKAVQDGTPSPDNPIDPIFSEETTVAVRGKNLLDVTTVQLGKSLYGANNKTCSFSNSAACAVMCARSITEGTAYTLSINNEYTKIDRMFIADAQNVAVISYNWYAFASERGPLINFTAERHPEAVSTEPITHIWFCIKKKDGTEITYEDVIAAEPRIVRGTYTAETMPAYEPYFDGGTATCPETLLAIPDTEYYDTWNPQTGEGIRRCAAIESYAGETIDTPYISSTGELSEGAYVVYGIPDTPFTTDPQPLIQPPRMGQIIQTAGTVDTPITVKCVTHS